MEVDTQPYTHNQEQHVNEREGDREQETEIKGYLQSFLFLLGFLFVP